MKYFPSKSKYLYSSYYLRLRLIDNRLFIAVNIMDDLVIITWFPIKQYLLITI